MSYLKPIKAVWASHRILNSEITVRFIISPSWQSESFHYLTVTRRNSWSYLYFNLDLECPSSRAGAVWHEPTLPMLGVTTLSCTSCSGNLALGGKSGVQHLPQMDEGFTDENTVMVLHEEKGSCILRHIIISMKKPLPLYFFIELLLGEPRGQTGSHRESLKSPLFMNLQSKPKGRFM